MDDQLTEGNPQSGGDGSATPQSSQTQGQPSGADFAQTIAKLQKMLEAQEGEIRALKSGKDKAVDRLEKTTGETLAKLAKYLNVDEDKLREAQRLSVIDEIIDERNGKFQPSQSIQGRVDGQGVNAESRAVVNFTVTDAINEVERFQLPTNEPSFIELLRKNPSREQVKDYILEKKAPQQPPSPADIVQSPSLNKGTKEVDVVALQQEQTRLLKNPSKNHKRLVEIDKLISGA